MMLRGVCVLALLVTGACHQQPASRVTPEVVRPERVTYRAGAMSATTAVRVAYWDALEHLDLERARRAAPDEEHRAFVDALRLTLDGEMHAAVDGLRHYYRNAGDSLLRSVARTMLVSVLTYQEDWPALYELSLDSTAGVQAGQSDRAGVLAWSEAMRQTVAPQYPALTRAMSVSLQSSPIGTPMVTVQVNGCSRTFWLDTGSSTTLVASDVAARCGVTSLIPDTLEMVTATGRVPAQPAIIDTLRLGKLTAAHVHAAIVPRDELQLNRMLMMGATAPMQIDGVVGFDFLRQFDVELDFQRLRVIFRRAGSLGSGWHAPRNLFWLGYPVVALADVNGMPMYFGFDTGADQSFVTPHLIAKLPSSHRPRERRHIAGFGSDTTETLPVLNFLHLQAARQHLFFTGLVVRDQRRLLFMGMDGILGSDISGVGRVRFDMRSGVFVVGEP